MQQKESKTSKHFWFSMTKSFIRLVACVCLGYQDFVGAGALLALAEIVGVFEEF